MHSDSNYVEISLANEACRANRARVSAAEMLM